MNFIKQYGLERSGTNYIKALIETNLKDTRVLSNLFGLKHEKYNILDWSKYDYRKDKNVRTDINKTDIDLIKNKFNNNDMYYVITVKNPYSWVVSYDKCHWIRANRGPLNTNKAKRYIDRWNTVNKNWLDTLVDINPEKCYITMYEDLFGEPERIINEISNKFNIDLIDNFKDINFKMQPGTDVFTRIDNRKKQAVFDRSVYKNKKYMKEIPKEVKKIIDNSYDNTIIERIKKYGI